MTGRRSVAWLCVLLAHALMLFSFLRLGPAPERSPAELETEPITLLLEPLPPESAAPPPHAVPVPPAATRKAPRATPPPAAASAGESAAITLPGHVDWPIEGRKSAARVLAAEAEAARIAKLFSGPGGTWASLTPREKSRLKKFRWKPGVDGLEYDEHGNAIYHISEGCVVVNLLFIGCALGKEKVHGDLFKDMRLYFDERRLPPLDTGNGNDDATRR
jgi:hypothetical protein